ncbi:MAG TPA: exodeoxyribonuclease VII small subunit [Candidatus Acetothermia bacterium]|jgi:exodeoxyribonuclease VII small subunit|nr:exodeoxyribonuclease VII small subunit [Candidatus Bipolaricaulota bacterium]HDO74319.1 exodeoxyribonuclease VII small subunit [Candidatus Acetothermia bacterium]HEX32261.1 exodeoxyribonuclease VII small subunit [Candidatus Acetothermia bacterium]
MKIDESLNRLEVITKRMGQEDVPLDEALALFEEGITLATGIKKSLDEARLKVQKVLEKAKDTFLIEDFDLQ